MIQDKHLRTEWECPEDDCDEDGMTAREFRNHGIEEHPENYPFADMYPQYYKCQCGGDSEFAQDVYLLAVAENGPYYMAYEKEDAVDEMHPQELLRHDWEVAFREETPFPEYEE